MRWHVPRGDPWMWIKSDENTVSRSSIFSHAIARPTVQNYVLKANGRDCRHTAHRCYREKKSLWTEKKLRTSQRQIFIKYYCCAATRRNAIANIKCDVKKSEMTEHTQSPDTGDGCGWTTNTHYMVYVLCNFHNCRRTIVISSNTRHCLRFMIIIHVSRPYCEPPIDRMASTLSPFVSITVSSNDWMYVLWLLSRVRFWLMLIVQPVWRERHSVAMHAARI